MEEGFTVVGQTVLSWGWKTRLSAQARRHLHDFGVPHHIGSVCVRMYSARACQKLVRVVNVGEVVDASETFSARDNETWLFPFNQEVCKHLQFDRWKQV